MNSQPTVQVIPIRSKQSFLMTNHRTGPFMAKPAPIVNKISLELLPLVTEAQPVLCRVSLPEALNEAISRLDDAANAFSQSEDVCSNTVFDALQQTVVFMDSINILTWNTCGAGNNDFLNSVRDIIRVHDPRVIALAEPRISGEAATRVCERIGFDGCLRMEADGFAGGIWLLWRTNEVIINQLSRDPQHITVEITRRGEEPWLLSTIYAAPNPTTRLDLWKSLEDFAKTNNKPWLLAGDWNATFGAHERSPSSSVGSNRSSQAFLEWVDTMNLIDLGYSGMPFTWWHGTTVLNRKFARLDRALCSPDWNLRFPNATVTHLTSAYSDHAPLLIQLNPTAPSSSESRPFKFQAAWSRHEKFPEFIKAQWQVEIQSGEALKSLSKDLQTWNKEVFGNVFLRKYKLERRLEGTRKQLAMKVSRYYLDLERQLLEEWEEILHQEQLIWYQKSRSNFLLDGDRNTRYYHLATKIRRRSNNISALQVPSGEWVMELPEIKKLLLDFFGSLYTAEPINPSLHSPQTSISCTFPAMTESQLASLEVPFSETEVTDTLKMMGAYKAPGPDGYPAVFFQQHWDLVGKQISETILGLLNENQFAPSLCDALMVLIPKVQNPVKPAQFRPISLLNVQFKIATKMIVNRLKPILPDLISPSQASFIPGRQIIDNVVIVQEVLHSMSERRRRNWMMIKIDLEKAYDRIRWDFLGQMLHNANLPAHLIDIIMKCQSLGNTELVLNGAKAGQFKPTRGIRQGDPLSPYLFVLCMEFLSHLIQNKVDEGAWKPISIGDVQLSHLFFADDLILFAEASVEQGNVVKNCLELFCEASGERVNYDKSSILFARSVHTSVKHEVGAALPIPIASNFENYLGVPIACGRMTADRYNFLLEKVSSRLKGWQTKTLSLAGRITLAKSVLVSLPLYTMQASYLPRQVCDGIDAKIRGFVWGSSQEQRRVHLLNKDVLQAPIVEGGLDIKSMRDTNQAILAKLSWRTLQNPTLLWSRVIRSKYCNGRADVDMFENKRMASRTWKGIVHGAQILTPNLRVDVGNGNLTLFWIHPWLQSTPLLDTSIQQVPDDVANATVAEMWLGDSWDWALLSPLLPPEVLTKLQTTRIAMLPEATDHLFWAHTESGTFTTKSAMQVIRQDRKFDECNDWKHIWKIPAQHRTRSFAFLVAHDAILCNVVRVRRHMSNFAACPRCSEEESCLHLLRDCPPVKKAWLTLGNNNFHDSFFSTIDVKQWVFENVRKENRWSSIFGYMIWFTWKGRNKLVFEGEESTEALPNLVWKQVSAFNLERIKSKTLATLPQGGTPTILNWSSPQSGWIKLNTDGVSKGNPGIAGGGGIFRDSAGHYLKAFTFTCGTASAIKAELTAVLHGLQIATKSRLPKLIIEVDSAEVIKFLQSHSYDAHANHHLVQECRQLLRDTDVEVKVTKIGFQANEAADKLANWSLSLSLPFTEHFSIPDCICNVLISDSSA